MPHVTQASGHLTDRFWEPTAISEKLYNGWFYEISTTEQMVNELTLFCSPPAPEAPPFFLIKDILFKWQFNLYKQK
jgi:hypothetical protein